MCQNVDLKLGSLSKHVLFNCLLLNLAFCFLLQIIENCENLRKLILSICDFPWGCTNWPCLPLTIFTNFSADTCLWRHICLIYMQSFILFMFPQSHPMDAEGLFIYLFPGWEEGNNTSSCWLYCLSFQFVFILYFSTYVCLTLFVSGVYKLLSYNSYI